MMATDERFDESISTWLEQTAPARLPERVLDATFERTRHSRQQVGWRAVLGRIQIQGGSRMSPSAIVLGGAAVLVLAAAVAVSLSDDRPSIGGPTTPPLPTTPDAWSRVVIDAGAEGGVDSVAAGPRGLLAAVGEGEASRLYFSADGREWTRVPADQHEPVGTNGAALVATDEGFLMVGNEVLASEDGLRWRRVAGPADDPDLRAGTRIAAAAAGPGFVAVGSDNTAWYSTGGTDWTLADVPPPPGEPSPLVRPLDPTQPQGIVEMLGIVAAGGDLVAWGTSNWVHDDGTSTFLPVLWASSDGRSWTNVPPPQPTRYATVAGGPNGFVMQDGGAVWLSADGRTWEHVAGDAFGASRWPGLQNDDGNTVEMILSSIAAGDAGYIAAGTDGICLLPCSSQEAVIWTSHDGRSWSRLPNDDLFRAPTGAGAGVAAAWGSRFIVGGASDGRPAVWMSGAEAPSAPPSTPAPTASSTSVPSAGDNGCTDLEAGPYSVTLGTIGITASVPDGWSGMRGHFHLENAPCLFGGPFRLQVSLVDGVVADACEEPTTVVEARTRADVIAALAAQAGRQAIEPTDTTLGGYPASRFEFGADFDMSACTAGNLRLWRSPDGEGEPVIDRGSIVTVYVVDVDGSALGVTATIAPEDATAANLAELDAVVGSLRFEPGAAVQPTGGETDPTAPADGGGLEGTRAQVAP